VELSFKVQIVGDLGCFSLLCIQNVTKDIMEATEGNLLALACLADEISESGEIEWRAACDNLPQILNRPEKKVVLGVEVHHAPVRTLWSAMELNLKSLEIQQAKSLLFMIFACQGKSVPEEILMIWNDCIKLKRDDSKLLKKMRSKEFVNFSPGGLLINLEEDSQNVKVPPYGALSLRPLVKCFVSHLSENGFMDGFRKEGMASGFVSYLNSRDQNNAVDHEKLQVADVLCGLYFEHGPADQIVMDVASKARSTSELQDCSSGLLLQRRRAIEPIIALIAHPKHGKWTDLGIETARKVNTFAL
jgi:hypothetical protein